MFKSFYFMVLGALGTFIYHSAFSNDLVTNLVHQFTDPSAYVKTVNTDVIEQIDGTAVAVSDGDTITVKSSYGNVIVRMFAIDAPEATCHGFSDKYCKEVGQEGSTESKLYLRELVLNKHVVVTLGHGMSGKRVVGTVYVNGEDVNLAMVNSGNAWHYKYYAKDQSPDDRNAYSKAENDARRLRSGIWAQSNPTAPWQWRQKQKTNHSY